MTDSPPNQQLALVAFTSVDGTPHNIAGDRSVVGSGEDADIRIRHGQVQARHCLIIRTADSMDVFDLTTDSSLRLNGKPVDASALTVGDELHLGDLRVVLVDPNAPVLPAGMQLAFGSPLPISVRNEAPIDYLDSFREALRAAPWLGISVILHVIVLLITSVMITDDAKPKEVMPTIAAELEQDADLADLEEASDEEVIEELEEELEEIEEEILDTIEIDPTTLDSTEPEAVDGDEEEPFMGNAALGPGDFASGDTLGGSDSSLSVNSLGGKVKKTVRRLQSSGLDIVILLDATASMQDEINATRTQMAQMISLLTTFGINFRLGVVAFRDHGDDYQTRVAPLTSHRFKAIDFMDKLSAEGGGDFPEGVLAAVKQGARMRYSRKAERVMILVGDAPPHDDELSATLKAIEKFQKKSGRFHAVYAGNQKRGFYRSNNETERTFQALAAAGGGTSVGIRSHDGLIEDIIALTLGITERDTIQRTLKKAQEGVVARVIRRKVKSGEASYVTKQLSRPTLSPLLPNLLLQENSPKLIPAYFAVLRDSKVPKPNRWLTHVLLKRQLAAIGRYQNLGSKVNSIIEDFNPEIPQSRQRRLLRELSLELERRGVRTTLAKPSPKGRPN